MSHASASASPLAGIGADLRALRIRESHLGRLLRVATLLYLAIPVAIWAVGWLRPWAAALVLGALAWGAAAGVRRFRHVGAAAPEASADERRIPLWHLVVAALPAMAMAWLTGAFGDKWQAADWLKHQAMLRELIESSWPVVYRTVHDPALLVYYVAQYLPAALVGKAMGWHRAHDVLGLTIAAGLALSSWWMLRLTRAHGLLVGAAMLAFSGMDVIGWAGIELVAGRDPLLLLRAQYIDGWALAWQYSAFAALIAWVPQHAIGGWLTSALLLDGMENGQSERTFLLVVGLAALWSPFAMLGLAPIILAAAFRAPLGAFPARLRAACTPANVAGVVLLVAIGAYFAARLMPVRFTDLPPEPGARPDGFMVYLGMYEWSVAKFFAWLLVFWVLEFAVLAAVSWIGLGRAKPALRAPLVACVVMLCVLPLFRYGQFNDLVMRVSIPAIFVIAVAALTVLARPESGRGMRALVLLVLLAGVPTAVVQAARYLIPVRRGEMSFIQPPANDLHDAMMVLGVGGPNPNNVVARQYIGSMQSFFARTLARPQAELLDRRAIVPPPRYR